MLSCHSPSRQEEQEEPQSAQLSAAHEQAGLTGFSLLFSLQWKCNLLKCQQFSIPSGRNINFLVTISKSVRVPAHNVFTLYVGTLTFFQDVTSQTPNACEAAVRMWRRNQRWRKKGSGGAGEMGDAADLEPRTWKCRAAAVQWVTRDTADEHQGRGQTVTREIQEARTRG